MPNRFAARPLTTSGFQQQNLLQSQAAPQQNLLPNQMAPQENLLLSQAPPQQDLLPNQAAPQLPNQMAPQQNLLQSQAPPQQTFLPNPSAPQQNLMSSQMAQGMPKSGDGMFPSQSAFAGSSAYGWNNSTSADQWQAQPQWSWGQGDNQWPSSQPLQYMVCYWCIYYKYLWLVHMIE